MAGARRKQQRDPRLPSPGTVIVKAYKGRELRLVVHEDHFELDGQSYRSLSEAARHVTGSRVERSTLLGPDPAETEVVMAPRRNGRALAVATAPVPLRHLHAASLTESPGLDKRLQLRSTPSAKPASNYIDFHGERSLDCSIQERYTTMVVAQRRRTTDSARHSKRLLSDVRSRADRYRRCLQVRSPVALDARLPPDARLLRAAQRQLRFGQPAIRHQHVRSAG